VYGVIKPAMLSISFQDCVTVSQGKPTFFPLQVEHSSNRPSEHSFMELCTRTYIQRFVPREIVCSQVPPSNGHCWIIRGRPMSIGIACAGNLIKPGLEIGTEKPESASVSGHLQ
jgi:hypothetical protein